MANSTLKLGNYDGEILFSTSGTSGTSFNPGTGYGSLYYGSDKKLRLKDDAGNITVFGEGGGTGGGLGLSAKNLQISAADFTFDSTNSNATITFAQPFASTNYSIDVMWLNSNSGRWNDFSTTIGVTISGKTAAGFTLTYLSYDIPTNMSGYVAYITCIALGETAISGTSGTSGMGGGIGLEYGGGSITSNVAGSMDGSALASNTTGANNTAFGYNTLNLNTIGISNVAIGYNALATNTDASGNTAIGAGTLQSNTTGSGNTAIGVGSLEDNTTGANNIGIGLASLGNNITGGNNIAIGNFSLSSNTNGISNNALGRYNTAVGHNTLIANTRGTYNIAVGVGAGGSITTGSNNIIIGSTGGSASLNDTIAFYASSATNVTINSTSIQSGTYSANRRIPIVIGGTTYYLLLST